MAKSRVNGFTVAALSLALFGCQQHVRHSSPIPSVVTPDVRPPKTLVHLPKASVNTNGDLLSRLVYAEDQASKSGQRVLLAGREMTLIHKEIIRGSCWDYADTVYERAGFARTKRLTVFRGSKQNGPYANINKIRPGDFLYYVNHSYHGVEHSAIFVSWENKNKRRALMLSYAGENRQSPARYKIYDLSHVYQITRPWSS